MLLASVLLLAISIFALDHIDQLWQKKFVSSAGAGSVKSNIYSRSMGLDCTPSCASVTHWISLLPYYPGGTTDA